MKICDFDRQFLFGSYLLDFAQNGTKTCHSTGKTLLFMVVQKLRPYTQQFLTCNHVTNRPCWWYGTKEYLISAIVGTSQRGRASLSGMSQEIGCHVVASQELTHNDMPKLDYLFFLYTLYCD